MNIFGMIFFHLKFLLKKKENVLLHANRIIVIPFLEKKGQNTPAPAWPKFAPLPHSHKKIPSKLQQFA
jgi:hypothetical protein